MQTINSSPPRCADDAPLYSLAGLGSLAQNPTFVREIKQVFVHDVPPRLAGLRAGIVAQNLPEVAREAHSIKSMMGMLGLAQAMELLRFMEQTAQAGRQQDYLLTSLQTLELLLAPVLEALRQELSVEAAPG